MSALARTGDRRLTKAEHEQLNDLEAVVARGEKAFVEVGLALKEIDHHRLYRAGYATFRDYMRHRWGKDKTWGYDRINAAQVYVNVLDRGQKEGTPKKAPANVEQARALAKVPVEEQAEVWAQAVELGEERGITGKIVEQAVKAAGFKVPAKGNFDVRGSSASSEHGTPEHLLVLVRAVFGAGIDLDPCTSKDNPTGAARFFTKDDDGLAQSWCAESVFMNPPWARDDGGVLPWVEKLADEYSSKAFEHGIACLPASVDTKWWQTLCVHPWCGPVGRLKYIGNEQTAQFPSAFVYLGVRSAAKVFAGVFDAVGPVYRRLAA